MTRTAVSLDRFVWLGNRINAIESPMNDVQCQRFGTFPDTCLTELCIEVKRIPASYRTPKTLTVTQNGELCMVTVIDGMHSVVCGQTIYTLAPFVEETEYGNPKRLDFIEVLGFTPDGLPVTKLTAHTQDDKKTAQIFYGSERKFINQHFFHTATLLPNGDLIYWENQPSGKIFLNNEAVAEKMSLITTKRFLTTPTGNTVYLTRYDRKYQLHQVGPADSSKFVCEEGFGDGRIVDFQIVDNDLVTIREKSIEFYGFQPDSSRLGKFNSQRSYFGNNPYTSDFRKLHDGRLSYIGRTVFDDLYCLIIDNESQPSFEHVSPLFQRDSVWMYYGIIGRRIFLMEIPQNKKRKS